jgi:acetyl-CoA/propionyl-CoA carboxylase biotin carboxyl carrier protein
MTPVEIRATIPGTISVVHVADGSTVADGETIIEVECMKSLWPLTAPAAGIVRLQVELGEMVAQDQVLAIIEAAT